MTKQTQKTRPVTSRMEFADDPTSISHTASIASSRWWAAPAWKQSAEKDDALAFRYRVEAAINRQIEKPGSQIKLKWFVIKELYDQEKVVASLSLYNPADANEIEQQQAKRLQLLNHAAIPQYLDTFEVETPLGPGFVIVQAAVDAKSVRDWIADGYCFDESELMQIAARILSALKYLHELHPMTIHRAIKPGNILLEDRRAYAIANYAPAKERRTVRPGGENRGFGRLYLINFGRSAVENNSGTLTAAGTYGYTAPEQFYGQACPPSDLYSLGATLIYLASGRPPTARMQANLQLQPQGLALSRPFVEWIAQLTQADVSRRSPSAAQALEELELLQKLGKPLAEQDYSMAITRSKLAAQPQTTYADFKVQSTAQELKIHFAFDRVRERSRYRKKVIKAPKLGSSELRMALYVLATIFFVGGSVAYTGSIFLGVWIAILLPGCFWLATPQAPEAYQVSNNDALKLKRRASVRILKDANGQMRLSLSTVPWISGKPAVLSSEIHFSNLPVRSLSTKPGLLSPKIKFTLTTHNPKRPAELTIVGSQEEIRWLRVHIGRWLKG